MAKENGKMMIIYCEPRSDEEKANGPPRERNVFNKHIAKCPHCGKESPVDPKHVGRGWETVVAPDPAQEAIPLTEDEIHAEREYGDFYEDYMGALGNLIILSQKIQKNVFMNVDGELAHRDKKLGEEQSGLLREMTLQVEDAKERVHEAQLLYNRLMRARGQHLQAWRDAQMHKEQQAQAKAKEAAKKNGQRGRLRARIKEVLG